MQVTKPKVYFILLTCDNNTNFPFTRILPHFNCHVLGNSSLKHLFFLSEDYPWLKL